MIALTEQTTDYKSAGAGHRTGKSKRDKKIHFDMKITEFKIIFQKQFNYGINPRFSKPN